MAALGLGLSLRHGSSARGKPAHHCFESGAQRARLKRVCSSRQQSTCTLQKDNNMKKSVFAIALAAGMLAAPSIVQATSLPAGSIIGGTNLTQSGTAVNALGQFSFNTSIRYAVYQETGTGHLDFLYQVRNDGPSGADSIDHVSSSSFQNFATTVGFVSPSDPQLAGAGFTTSGTIVDPTSTNLGPLGKVANWSFTGGSVPPFDSTSVLVAFTDATNFTQGTTDISNSGSKDFVTWAPATTASVPEPASALLLAGCFGGLGFGSALRRWRKS